MKKLLSIWAIVLLHLLPQKSNHVFSQKGGVLAWNPKYTGLAKGRGFFMQNKSSAALPFLKNQTFTKGGRGESTTRMRAISSYDSILEELNLDAKASAEYLSFDAAASLKINKSYFKKKNQLVIGIFYKVDNGTELIEDYEIIPKAESLLTAHDFKKFIQSYGDYYVSGVQVGQILSIFIKFSNIDIEDRESILSQMEGGADFGVAGGSASVSLQTLVAKYSKENTINLDAYYIGKGNDFKKDAELLKLVTTKLNEEQFTSYLIDAINERVKVLEKTQNESILGYIYSPMSQFGIPDEMISEVSDIKQDRRASISNLYRNIKTSEQQFAEIREDDYFKQYGTKEDLRNVVDFEDELSKVSESLIKAYNNCQKDDCEKSNDCCSLLPHKDSKLDIAAAKPDYQLYSLKMANFYEKAANKYSQSPHKTYSFSRSGEIRLMPNEEVRQEYSVDDIFSPNSFNSNLPRKLKISGTFTYDIDHPSDSKGSPKVQIFIKDKSDRYTQIGNNNGEILGVNHVINQDIYKRPPGDGPIGNISDSFYHFRRYTFTFSTDTFPFDLLNGAKEIKFKYVDISGRPAVIVFMSLDLKVE